MKKGNNRIFSAVLGSFKFQPVRYYDLEITAKEEDVDG